MRVCQFRHFGNCEASISKFEGMVKMTWAYEGNIIDAKTGWDQHALRDYWITSIRQDDHF